MCIYMYYIYIYYIYNVLIMGITLIFWHVFLHLWFSAWQGAKSMT